MQLSRFRPRFTLRWLMIAVSIVGVVALVALYTLLLPGGSEVHIENRSGGRVSDIRLALTLRVGLTSLL